MCFFSRIRKMTDIGCSIEDATLAAAAGGDFSAGIAGDGQLELALSCLCCQQAFAGTAPRETAGAAAAVIPLNTDPISDAPYILTPCGHVVCGACASATVANGGRCVFGHCDAKVVVTSKPDVG